MRDLPIDVACALQKSSSSGNLLVGGSVTLGLVKVGEFGDARWGSTLKKDGKGRQGQVFHSVSDVTPNIKSFQVLSSPFKPV